MRPIKFRGLSINGDWFYGLLSISQGLLGQPAKGSYISNSVGMPWAYQVRPETVGQYSGLKDKNGKEIYKDDIMAMLAWDTANFPNDENKKKWITIVEFKYGTWYLGYGNFENTNPCQSLYECHSKIEIIGNLFENSELLKYKFN